MQTAVTSKDIIPMSKSYRKEFRNMNVIMDCIDGLSKKFFLSEEVPQLDRCIRQRFLWKH